MEITKRSELLNRDVLSRLKTNVEGQLSFNNLNKIEWNNFSLEEKAEFFMRHVYHDGVDPRIKHEINRLVNEHIDMAKDELFAPEPLNPLRSTSFSDKDVAVAMKVKADAGEQLLKKVDLKLRNEAMVCVIKELVDEIHFYEI